MMTNFKGWWVNIINLKNILIYSNRILNFFLKSIRDRLADEYLVHMRYHKMKKKRKRKRNCGQRGLVVKINT